MKRFLIASLVVISSALPMLLSEFSSPIDFDPQWVSANSSQMTIFEPPAGFSADYTASALGYTVTVYSEAQEQAQIYVIQSEQSAEGTPLSLAFTELVPGSHDPSSAVVLIESIPVNVNGQETTIQISEYKTQNGAAVRQASIAIQDEGVSTLIVFSEPSQSWDMGRVYTILGSMIEL